MDDICAIYWNESFPDSALLYSVHQYLETATSTIVKQPVIPDNRHIDIELPADVPVGEAIVTLTIEPKNSKKMGTRLGELFGQGKGEIRMRDDFDAPLKDFEEYMR